MEVGIGFIWLSRVNGARLL